MSLKEIPEVKARSKTEYFLVGQSSDNISSSTGKLPLGRDVLKYLPHLKNILDKKNIPVQEIICCPLMSGTREASCDTTGCCSNSEGQKCVVAKMKKEGLWTISGLPILTDQSTS